MKIICPNLKNEEVAREFEELKNATSEAAAYHIWSQNNGNGIDKAPNGEPSKLFSDLLEHYNGDRVAAIQAKARTYSKSFKEWFGESKVVDENGEPKLMFRTDDKGKNIMGRGDGGPFFATDNILVAASYAFEDSSSLYKGFINLKNPYIINEESHGFYLMYNGKQTSIPEITETLIKEGYDGVLYKRVWDVGDYIDYDPETDYWASNVAVFNPNQMKSIDNQGTFSTQDNNIYLADSNTENISQLESMQSYSNSKELLDNMDSEMATVLNDVASKINMQPVSIEYIDRPLNEMYPEATSWTPAIYDRKSNAIVVNRNGDFSRYGSLENVLLHEIAHAITLDSLASNTEAANELRKIQKEYAEKHDDHASKNVYEFAAAVSYTHLTLPTNSLV